MLNAGLAHDCALGIRPMYGLSAITIEGGTGSPTIPIVRRQGEASGLGAVAGALSALLLLAPALFSTRSNRVYTLSPGLTAIKSPVAAFGVNPQLAASD